MSTEARVHVFMFELACSTYETIRYAPPEAAGPIMKMVESALRSAGLADPDIDLLVEAAAHEAELVPPVQYWACCPICGAELHHGTYGAPGAGAWVECDTGHHFGHPYILTLADVE